METLSNIAEFRQHVSRISNQTQLLMGEVLKDVGLNSTQWQVLEVLAEESTPVPRLQISSKLGIGEKKIAKALKFLKDRKLIETVKIKHIEMKKIFKYVEDGKNNFVLYFEIAKTGIEKYNIGNKYVNKFYKPIMKYYGEAEKNVTNSMLDSFEKELRNRCMLGRY